MTVNNINNTVSRAKVNGIELAYDTFGDPLATPMLLVMGLGAQMIAWDEEFCQQLADRGYWVIRFDNRDVGLSTRLDEAGVPDIQALMTVMVGGAPGEAPYQLLDMAKDAVGLLDALGIDSAHVIGASMGGMIAQEMAIHFPERVRTLTSVMSNTGDPEADPPSPEALQVLLEPAPLEKEAYLESAVAASRALSGPAWPIDEGRVRERATRAFERGLSPKGTARQMAAILVSGSREQALRSLSIPTLVIHGEADPLIPVSAGIATAEAVPGAGIMVIPGMGHDLPPALFPQVVDRIIAHAVDTKN
jgi:pimeloyl-ACP methyl ester carboxylesterase